MTISYVGAGAVYNATTNNLGCAVAPPAGVAEGDVLIAQIWSTTTNSPTSVPEGWSLVCKNGTWHFYSYICGDKPLPASFTWVFTGNVWFVASIHAWHMDTSGKYVKLDAYGNTTYTTSDTILRQSGLTTSAAGQIAFFGMNNRSLGAYSIAPPTNPGTFTEHHEYQYAYGAATDIHIEVADYYWASSGAAGNIDATLGGSLTTKHAVAMSLIEADYTAPDHTQRVSTLGAMVEYHSESEIARITTLGLMVEYHSPELGGRIEGVAAMSATFQTESVDWPLGGSLDGSGTLTGALTLSHQDLPLAGSMDGAGALTGSLTLTHQDLPLAGVLAGTGTLTGSLTVAHELAGSLGGSATLLGTLTLSNDEVLQGVIAGSGTLLGDLTLDSHLAGVISSAGTLTGELSGDVHLAGILVGAGSMVGDLTCVQHHLLSAVLSGHSVFSAELTTQVQRIMPPKHRQLVGSGASGRAIFRNAR